MYTENEKDWGAKKFLVNLKKAEKITKKHSWHEVLLEPVSNFDVVICTGLSAGVLAEPGYMKWNLFDKKGKVKVLVGITEFLSGGQFPPEIAYPLRKIIALPSVDNLEQTLRAYEKR